jgi:hypothetical protein
MVEDEPESEPETEQGWFASARHGPGPTRAMAALAWAGGMMSTLVIAARRRRRHQLQTSLRRAYTEPGVRTRPRRSHRSW